MTARRGVQRERCRCGNLLVAKLCFGCDNLPDNCSCLEMVFARAGNPPVHEPAFCR